MQPSCYGFELALWLALQLNERSIVTSYPENTDDWSWSIGYSSPSGAEFSLHCHSGEEPRALWRIVLKRYPRKLFGRGKPPWSDAAPLTSTLRTILQDAPDVELLRWSSPAL